MKHLKSTVALAFVGRGKIVKLAQISFPSLQFSRKETHSCRRSLKSQLSSFFFFLSFLCWQPSHVHLKEVRCSCSLVCLSCQQHHYSETLWTLWSKIRVTCSPALRSRDSPSDHWDSYQLTKGQSVLDKGGGSCPGGGWVGGQGRVGARFHHTIQDSAWFKI